MDITHLKYVIEVANTGSITQASINLGMNQPNLSKAVKALEHEMGIVIFRRSSKGVLLTEEGKTFVEAAQEIVNRMNVLESRYASSAKYQKSFGLSVPWAGYISKAFSCFLGELFPENNNLMLDYCEAGSMQAIENVSSMKHTLGIIRFPVEQERHYRKLLQEVGLHTETLLRFTPKIILSSKSAALVARLSQETLTAMTQIIDEQDEKGFLRTGFLPGGTPGPAEGGVIQVRGRVNQLALLAEAAGTYICSSSLPVEDLKAYHLVEKDLDMCFGIYIDLLIQPSKYTPNDLELRFLKHLYFCRDLMEKMRF